MAGTATRSIWILQAISAASNGSSRTFRLLANRSAPCLYAPPSGGLRSSYGLDAHPALTGRTPSLGAVRPLRAGLLLGAVLRTADAPVPQEALYVQYCAKFELVHANGVTVISRTVRSAGSGAPGSRLRGRL